MSVHQHFQQLQQDLQNELTTTNQLLHLILLELQQIKAFTCPGGELETNIKENVSTMDTLSRFLLSKENIENLPPVLRGDIDMSHHTNQNQSYEEHDTFRDISNISQ